jgi:hypothetical protein
MKKYIVHSRACKENEIDWSDRELFESKFEETFRERKICKRFRSIVVRLCTLSFSEFKFPFDGRLCFFGFRKPIAEPPFNSFRLQRSEETVDGHFRLLQKTMESQHTFERQDCLFERRRSLGEKLDSLDWLEHPCFAHFNWFKSREGCEESDDWDTRALDRDRRKKRRYLEITDFYRNMWFNFYISLNSDVSGLFRHKSVISIQVGDFRWQLARQTAQAILHLTASPKT